MIRPTSATRSFLATLLLASVVFAVTGADHPTPLENNLGSQLFTNLRAQLSDNGPDSNGAGSLSSNIRSNVLALHPYSQEPASLARNEILPTKRVVSPARDSRARVIKGISRARAIAIARKDALRSYKTLKQFNVVPCEQVLFWRVIYDGGGPEHVIDKSSGRIIRSQIVPHGSRAQASTQARLNKDKAIQIATADAEKTYGPKAEAVDQFAVFACELTNSWRVIFDYHMHPGERVKDFPNASFPKYVVEKGTGKIIHKQLN